MINSSQCLTVFYYCPFERRGPCTHSKTLNMKTQTGGQDVMAFTRFTFNPKEGIDNPALNINDDPDPDVSVVPLLCHLRRVEGQNFGFSLQRDRCGQWHRGVEVSGVQPWGVAEQRGLKLGDTILEINEENVQNMDFHTVMRKIQFCGCDLFLLVLRKDKYEQALSLGLDLQSLVKELKGENCHRPRLCHITRDPQHGLGFSLISLEGQRGDFIVSTVSGGPAERAGVSSGDKLIWINGTRAASLSQSALNRMLRKSLVSVTLLVIDSLSESSFTKRKIPIVPEVAVCCSFPHRARTMNLTKGKDGFGFLLRQERTPANPRMVHVLREVDGGSPAHEAGMEDGDLLLAVNSDLVEALEHDEIVKLIRRSGDCVSLTALSMEGRDLYKQLGISPLLFHEDPMDLNEMVLTSQASKTSEEFFL